MVQPTTTVIVDIQLHRKQIDRLKSSAMWRWVGIMMCRGAAVQVFNQKEKIMRLHDAAQRLIERGRFFDLCV